jgi:hypothetical protein
VFGLIERLILKVFEKTTILATLINPMNNELGITSTNIQCINDKTQII